MKKTFGYVARVLLTLLVVAAAGFVADGMWTHYMDDPWTRDAHVSADVVGVTPDVSGLVSDVLVRDNQTVKKGDVLFRVDRARFQLALEQAQATEAARKAALDQANRDLQRYEKLGGVVSQQQTEQARSAAAQAAANYREAQALTQVAQLNLQRSDVRASVNGTVTNVSLQPGDYVTAGKAELALIDGDSLRVDGYFEETKLPRIHVGDKVDIKLMGYAPTIVGHVQSIAAGIVDRERTDTGLLANVNPTFSWVRLAQRVPVRIALDNVPSGVRLVAGQTATVSVLR